jgi:hypothetical protein
LNSLASNAYTLSNTLYDLNIGTTLNAALKLLPHPISKRCLISQSSFSFISNPPNLEQSENPANLAPLPKHLNKLLGYS